jgi:hypothetical protein
MKKELKAFEERLKDAHECLDRKKANSIKETVLQCMFINS